VERIEQDNVLLATQELLNTPLEQRLKEYYNQWETIDQQLTNIKVAAE